ncbi:hypothetical protein FIBSPDRAFT_970862 [Athelia psychrophila]|uniref:Uncharacterized protein n=1 Tax=Athelia psychrophila TaxID=1759441 RepID=A0A167SGQ3_9AGAM|nr:hypothetical protein FIBSPDRAFT_970862 [Fibularhizoctonia sp. CBS 109695]
MPYNKSNAGAPWYALTPGGPWSVASVRSKALQASGSSSLKIEVHNHINGRNKFIGGLKDTVDNLLKESSSGAYYCILALRKY